MKNALTTVIAVVIAMTLSTTTALAGDCSTTAYANFQTSYPYQVTDVQGSGKPVLNGGVTWTRGNWRFDAFGSKDLSGKERFGNEVDLTAAYASSVMTPVGHVHYEALVSWWLLPDFGKVGDDLVQLQFDAARPFVLFSTTVSP